MAVGAFIFCFIISLSMILCSVKVVAITCDGQNKVIKTLNNDILGTLKSLGISWEWYDIVNMDKKGTKYNVSITRTFPVNLLIDGESKISYVTGGSVSDLLKNYNITLANDDEINFPLETSLSKDINVHVKRIIYKEYTETVKLPFKITKINVMYYGSAVKMPSDKAGTEGVRYITKRDKLVDGVVTETKVLKDWVALNPKVATVYVPLKGPVKKVNGAELNYKNVYTMTATAYSSGRRTATGIPVSVGCVAINPKYCTNLKLGDKLYIETSDGRFIYGYCTVNDKGGYKSGDWIDIFLPSEKDCRAFGMRSVKVYVLE